MPVQINELTIRAKVNESGEAPQAANQAATLVQDREDLIRECVEAVLRKLEMKMER